MSTVLSVHDVYKDRVCGLCAKNLELVLRGTGADSAFDRYCVKHGRASRVYNNKSSVVAERIEKHYPQPYPKDKNFPPFICDNCRWLLLQVAVEGKDYQLPYEIPFETEFEARHINIGVAKISELNESQFKSVMDCPTCSDECFKIIKIYFQNLYPYF